MTRICFMHLAHMPYPLQQLTKWCRVVSKPRGCFAGPEQDAVSRRGALQAAVSAVAALSFGNSFVTSGPAQAAGELHHAAVVMHSRVAASQGLPQMLVHT